MTAPSWVPAGALIHIDLVGGTPQGQAYVPATDSVVAVNTLLGVDPVTSTAYGETSKYDPTYLMAGIGYGIAASSDTKFTVAAIGALRTALMAGCTLVFTTNMTNPDGSYDFYWGWYSNNAYPATAAVENVLKNSGGDAYISTYLGTPSGMYSQIDNCFDFEPNLLTRVAMTLTSTRAEFAVNGFGPNVKTLDATNLPPAKPLAAFLFNGRDEMALDSVTVYATEADSSNLAEMSVVSAPEVEGAVANMDGVASMFAIGGSYTAQVYEVALTQNVVSGIAPIKTFLARRVGITQALQLADSPPTSKTRGVKALTEKFKLTHSQTPRTQFHSVFTSSVTMWSALAPSWQTVPALVQGLSIGQTSSQRFIWGRALTQALKISAAVNISGRYELSLAQLFKLAEVRGLRLAHPTMLSEGINLSSLLVGGTSLKLLQKLLVSTALSPGFAYHFALTSRVIVQGFIDKLFTAIVTELFTLHDAGPTHAFTANSSLAQLLTIHPALNTKLILKIEGHLQLSPEQLVQAIYRGDPLLDGVIIHALYISPAGTTTTWVVNTRTNAVTEYLDYDFRSFAQMGNRYIAAGAEGLYELDGDTDDGDLIIAEMMSGYLQLNEKKMFGIKGAYVAIRGGGRFYLKLISGDGREYVYELKAQPNLMTTKVKVGKGISTTYMAYALVTEGQDFDLDSIEFIPMTRGRRV